MRNKRRFRKPQLQGLEQRCLLAGLISEVNTAPLFTSASRGQYIELRGEPSESTANQYLVVVEGDSGPRAGDVHTIFDLNGHAYGENGFLAILPHNHVYQLPATSATLIESTSDGFRGLPGEMFHTSNTISNHIDFIVGSNTFFLIESDVAPSLDQDIDSNNDGEADSLPAQWNILDSVSILDFGLTNFGYGDIVFHDNDNIVTKPDATLIRVQSPDYVARIGDSTGSSIGDWVGGNTQDVSNDGLGVRLTHGIFGDAGPLVFSGRELNHIGTHNFVGAVRGQAFEDVNNNGVVDPSETVAGIAVFADTNRNGIRDEIITVVNANDFEDRIDMTNVVPNVTMTVGDQSTGEPIGFVVRPVNAAFEERNVFAHEGVGFWSDIRKFRLDFYNATSSVTFHFEGSGNVTHGRVEAFNSAGESIQVAHTQPLANQQRGAATVAHADISYVVAYSDTDGPFEGSSPFGRIDRFEFTQPEVTSITDAEGRYVLNHLFPDDYNIVAAPRETGGTLGDFSAPVTFTENYRYDLPLGEFRDSPLPILEALDPVVFEEGLVTQDTLVSQIVVANPNPSQTLNFGIVGGDASSWIRINAQTGELTVREDTLLDHEAMASWDLQLVVTDTASNSISTPVGLTIHVTDKAEGPQISGEGLRVTQGAPAGTSIGSLVGVDDDSESVGDWQITGGTAESLFSINAVTGELTVAQGAVFNAVDTPTLTLTVSASDGGETPIVSEATVEIEVLRPDQRPPAISRVLPIGLLEGTYSAGHPLGTVNLSTPEQTGDVRFTIIDGSARPFLNIVPDTGAVSILLETDLDFEQQDQWTFVVEARNFLTGIVSEPQEFTIFVSDTNEPPVVNTESISVPEKSAADTFVGVLQGFDPETENVWNWRIVGGSAADQFKVEGSTGVVTVAENAVLDHIENPELSLVIEAMDISIPSRSSTVTIPVMVTDANDPPTIESADLSIEENSAVGESAGRILATDDFSQLLRYEIVGGSGQGLFEIDAEGNLTLTDAGQVDHESNASHSLDVEVTDGEGASIVQSIVVTVVDVNEPPVVTGSLEPISSQAAIELRLPLPADLFTDPDDEALVINLFGENGTQRPDWLEYDPDTRSIVGLPWNRHEGTVIVEVQAANEDPAIPPASIQFEWTISANQRPWTNQVLRADVNSDGDVEPIDALRILNQILRFGGGDIPEDESIRTGFFDTNSDGRVGPIDALIVLNDILRQRGANAEYMSAAVPSITSGHDDEDADELLELLARDLIGR